MTGGCKLRRLAPWERFGPPFQVLLTAYARAARADKARKDMLDTMKEGLEIGWKMSAIKDLESFSTIAEKLDSLQEERALYEQYQIFGQKFERLCEDRLAVVEGSEQAF